MIQTILCFFSVSVFLSFLFPFILLLLYKFSFGRYDTDCFFGRTAQSPCDYQSVMVTGKSVCQGYSNVMEEMCK